MIKAIHQSMINSAFKCGEQFRRRYIENEIIPPGIAAGRGTGVHNASKINLRQKIASKVDLPLSDLQDAARDGFVGAFKNGIYMTKEDIPQKTKIINEGLEDALICTEVYHDSVAPQIDPVAVEEPFCIEVGLPLPLAGTMDHESTPRIDDLKTSSKKWAEGKINEEIQPVLYSFVKEFQTHVRPDFIYHIMISRRGKDGNLTSSDYQEQRYKAEDRHYAALIARLRNFIFMLQAGSFPPSNQNNWWCGEKWCGYWNTCEYVGNGKQSKWI
jgi:hypothetical protein